MQGEGRIDEWIDNAQTTQVLIRSQIEIARLLAKVCQYGDTLVCAPRNCAELFISRLLRVDATGSEIVAAYASSKLANAAVLDLGQVGFNVCHSLAQIEFLAANPAEAVLDGAPVLRFDLPDTLLVRRGRRDNRMPLIPRVPLRCVADAGGVIPFEAEILDISSGGLGCLVHDQRVHLLPGTILHGCRIFGTGGEPVAADLIVRYSTRITMPDGTAAMRTGCSFVTRTEDLERLLSAFVVRYATGA